MSDDLRLVLVRVLDNGTWADVGYTLAHQAIRRPVTFRVNRDGTPGEETLDGLALIGENDEHPGKLSVEALARQVGKVALKIERTTELLWLPVAAHRDALVGMWTIECVPLVAWFRVAQRTDEDILRLAGVDPVTGELLDVRPCPACGGKGYTGVTGSADAGSIPIPCTACMGSGQAAGWPTDERRVRGLHAQVARSCSTSGAAASSGRSRSRPAGYAPKTSRRGSGTSPRPPPPPG